MIIHTKEIGLFLTIQTEMYLEKVRKTKPTTVTTTTNMRKKHEKIHFSLI